MPKDNTGDMVALTSAGGLFAWEFERDGRQFNVRVDGRATFNSIIPVLGAAVERSGVAHVPQDLAAPYLATDAGRGAAVSPIGARLAFS